MDDMSRDGKDIHNTNPCEELNFHGFVNDNFTSVPPNENTNHGYPEVRTPILLAASLYHRAYFDSATLYGTPPSCPPL